VRRPVDIASLVVAGICTATLGCESVKPRVRVPNVDLPTTEEVYIPVQITARESAPPLHG
jgi:hypothetical protein